MKLRLETGNFKITGTIDHNANTITIDDLPKGLSSEDFIGCVADMGADGLFVITHTSGTEDLYGADDDTKEVTFTIADYGII